MSHRQASAPLPASAGRRVAGRADGYAASGSLCLAPEQQQCPAYYTPTVGVCAPSLQPWAPAGIYAGQVEVGAVTCTPWPHCSRPTAFLFNLTYSACGNFFLFSILAGQGS